jgi:hypothetical protein
MERSPPHKKNYSDKNQHCLTNNQNMKTFFFKISAFVLLFALMGAGCKKDEEDLSYLDNTIPFNVNPGFAIYKTKKDYFFNVQVRPMEKFILSYEFNDKTAQITLYKGKYYYNERYRLINDYVVSTMIDSDCYFTSLSFDTYIREKLSDEFNQGATNPKVIDSIIDRDPFTEFYYCISPFNGKTEFTIAELNQLIKDKNLEKYFQKVK